MEAIKECLVKFIEKPYNDELNFKLGYSYDIEKQYATAYSYYLRCAEYTDNNIFAAESLIRCSLCINKQKNRDEKELYLIKHAITASPCSIEPYYIASLYFSWRSGNAPEKRLWLDSYMYACMGINLLENNLETVSFKNDIGYSKENIYYQKAYAGKNIGKIDEARDIYTRILTSFDISDSTRKFITLKKNELPEPSHDIIKYSNKKINSLKFNFERCNKIENNYSQIYQDMFVLSMNNGTNSGTYLEIGAGDYKYGNNTYLLEYDFNWSGVSIDINIVSVEGFNNVRKNKCLCADATKIDYIKLLNENYESTNIDYLQLDCDPPNITFDILSKIPFDNYKFGVITYEHDHYNDNTGKYREKSREFLKERGYKLIAGNISSYKDKCPFEDWWIHPELVDENIYKLFERDEDIPINGEKYMLTKSKYIQEPIFEISNKLITINNYHKNTPATFKLFKVCNICDCIRRGYRWEEHQHNIIDKFLNEKSIAIEAGSHIGTISVKLARTCKFTYCFEPVINTYSLLEFNMNKNCIPKKFKLFNKGLGESIKNENISWISQEGSGGIGLTNNFFESTIQRDKTEVIEIITIDSLKLDRLDYIKIDVEGYEEHVINGGINTIKKYKPIIVLECYETFSPLKPASLEYVKNKYQFIINIGYKIEYVWNADFLFIPIKNIINKNIITFGTDNLFKKKKKRFEQEARNITFFDSIIIENENSIKSIMEDHKEFITNNKRGYGYWIWKPFIIKNQLEKMKNNDILFYLDCGSSIINNNVERLDNYINKLRDYDVIVFDNSDHKMKKFVKMNVINEFNIEEDILEQYIIEGGCIILKNTKKTKEFIDEWINYMIKDNYQLLNDDLLNFPQYEQFIEHRHDQSILTILARQKDYIYINNGLEELYNKGPLFHSRLTDIGPRQYAKPIPNIKLEFTYFYSPLYNFYHEHIKENLSQNFNINPIKIKDIDINNNRNNHHFTNITIKLELIVSQIKKNLSKFIIFSDATIFINKLNVNKMTNYINYYKKYDICLIDESQHNSKNIGLMLIYCNSSTLDFFKEALNLINKKQFNHYQKCINYLININKYNLKYGLFDKKIYCGLDFIEEERDNYIIYKSLIKNSGNKIDNYNFRIKHFYDNNLINKLDFEKWTNYSNNVISNINPNLIVIDNFYKNPDEIRDYALKLNYEPPENHGAVGYRSESGRKILDGTKELFEKLLHKSILNGNSIGEWNYSTNGCFQWCNASVPIVYHSDSQQYAGIIYLTPDAPPNTGTSFFRHKKYKLRNSEIFSKSDWYESDLKYKEPHLDKTQWEIVDSIGNVYNRLVIFNAQQIHGVTEYFGEDINNSRLFQLFFFNLENSNKE